MLAAAPPPSLLAAAPPPSVLAAAPPPSVLGTRRPPLEEERLQSLTWKPQPRPAETAPRERPALQTLWVLGIRIATSC